MMLDLLSGLFLLHVIYLVNSANIPQGYILDVNPVCEEKSPTVNILTDLNIRAVAKCGNGEQNFTKVDAAHYTLAASFTHLKAGCLFLNYRSVHKLEVRVMYGGHDSGLLGQEQIYTVSCTFAFKSSKKSPKHAVSQGKVRPKEILVNAGTQKVDSRYVSLFLQDVKNKNIAGSVPMDKSVSLLARTEGTYRSYQPKAVSCFAVGAKSKKKYAILKAGCGDGEVFAEDQGFITTGSEARSPYFKTFYVEGDQIVSFECSFILCKGCNGNSCTVGSNIKG